MSDAQGLYGVGGMIPLQVANLREKLGESDRPFTARLCTNCTYPMVKDMVVINGVSRIVVIASI